MFGRYSMLARRVIFFARMEAGRLGATGIVPEHLLLGVVRVDFEALQLLAGRGLSDEAFTATVLKACGASGAALPDNAEMPLTGTAQQALGYAQEEADRLGHKDIRAAHLVLGLLRTEGIEARRLLLENEIALEPAREVVRRMPAEPVSPPDTSYSAASFDERMRKLREARENPGADTPADPEPPRK